MKIKYTKKQLDFFRQEGSRGGKSTAKKLGTKHYSDIAKKRWENQKKLSTERA